MGIGDELEKLERLRQNGSLTDEEYAKAKQSLLGSSTPLWANRPVSEEDQTRLWAMLLHLSVFAGYVVPLAGWVLPIAIWQIKKSDLPQIDAHGKVVVNWIISGLIYVIVSTILIFVVVGIPMLIVLGILSVIFPIFGAIKANNGEVWKYPLSIPFF